MDCSHGSNQVSGNTLRMVYTIGVYGWKEGDFLDALCACGVQTLVDVRWRRSVRLRGYGFSNSQRLQQLLEGRQIDYLHARYLAPPPEVRHTQHRSDKAQKILKTERRALSPEFVERYQQQILTQENLQRLLCELSSGTNCIALLCVEQWAQACHRSLIANALKSLYHVEVNHLEP